MEKLMRSFPFRRRKESSLEASKPYIWQEDEKRVRDGSCHFSVKVIAYQYTSTLFDNFARRSIEEMGIMSP